jgi:hypothetical protein
VVSWIIRRSLVGFLTKIHKYMPFLGHVVDLGHQSVSYRILLENFNEVVHRQQSRLSVSFKVAFRVKCEADKSRHLLIGR